MTEQDKNTNIDVKIWYMVSEWWEDAKPHYGLYDKIRLRQMVKELIEKLKEEDKNEK